MNKSEHRKSGLFSSLKSRRSLRDLSARVQKTSLLISVPFTHPLQDTNSLYSLQSTVSNTAETQAPLSPLDLNATQGRRLSKIYGEIPIPENTLKRSPMVWKKRSSSPSSELTLATISATPSELALEDMESEDLPSPTIAEHEEKNDSPEQINARHLQYTQYADMLDLEEPCTPTRIHRTLNIGDMRKFMVSDDMLPINNRKSLEFEAHELEVHRSRICSQDINGHNCVMLLVENAFVMTFFGGDSSMRFWDDLDTSDVLKGELDDYVSELLPV